MLTTRLKASDDGGHGHSHAHGHPVSGHVRDLVSSVLFCFCSDDGDGSASGEGCHSVAASRRVVACVRPPLQPLTTSECDPSRASSPPFLPLLLPRESPSNSFGSLELDSRFGDEITWNQRGTIIVVVLGFSRTRRSSSCRFRVGCMQYRKPPVLRPLCFAVAA